MKMTPTEKIHPANRHHIHTEMDLRELVQRFGYTVEAVVDVGGGPKALSKERVSFGGRLMPAMTAQLRRDGSLQICRAE